MTDQFLRLFRTSKTQPFGRNSSKRHRRGRPGFTLIEALSVIAIIGLLLSIGAFIFSQALRQARDAKRKSDLNAIAQSFEARFLDQTCANQAAIGLYPGQSLQADKSWVKVANLASYSDGCGPFSKYLPTIPNDVRQPKYNYYFNLSTIENSNGVSLPAVAKHYRLAASLERQFASGSADQKECVRLSQIWVTNFGGVAYDCETNGISEKSTPKMLGLGNVFKVKAAESFQNSDSGSSNNGNGSDNESGNGNNGGGGNSGSSESGNSTVQSNDYNYYIGR